jgi:hypothetical protein
MLTKEQKEEIIELIKENRMVVAIKMVREWTGLGLKDARDVVNTLSGKKLMEVVKCCELVSHTYPNEYTQEVWLGSYEIKFCPFCGKKIEWQQKKVVI